MKNLLRFRHHDIKARIFEYYYDEAVILPHNRWAVNINFRLVGINGGSVHYEKVYTLICSPEYIKNPSDDYRDEIDDKVMVYDYLDKKAIENKVEAYINTLNDKNYAGWEEYYLAIRKEFYIDD